MGQGKNIMDTIKRVIAATLFAALLPQGTVRAQSAAGTTGVTSSTFYSMVPSTGDTTAEERAANAEKTVVVNFTSFISSASSLQLVVLVQDHYRRGYRKFLIPMQTAGGSVYGAMYAYEALSAMPIEIATVAMGNVDSAGIYLYCLGDRRYATPGSSFLFHPIQGAMTPNRREQEATERMIEAMVDWTHKVNRDCFGDTPEEWDLDRRDYRVMMDEATEVGLVNAGSDYFEAVSDLGSVTYTFPTYYSAPQ